MAYSFQENLKSYHLATTYRYHRSCSCLLAMLITVNLAAACCANSLLDRTGQEGSKNFFLPIVYINKQISIMIKHCYSHLYDFYRIHLLIFKIDAVTLVNAIIHSHFNNSSIIIMVFLNNPFIAYKKY